jgi:hypothetical protein
MTDLSSFAITGTNNPNKQVSVTFWNGFVDALETAIDAASGATVAITDVTGLQAALDGKQAVGDYATADALTSGLAGKQPTGDYATVTDLTTGLSSKQPTGDYATNTDLANGLAGKQPTGNYATGGGVATGTNTGDQVLPTRTSLGLATGDNVTFRDVTATRGDGTGVLWLATTGGAYYLYFDGTNYNLPDASLVVGGDVNVTDDPYDAALWNGSLEVPTKNAVRDKIESLSVGLMAPQEWAPNFTAAGDVYIPAVVAMTISQGNATIGTGTLAYTKSTAAAPSTFGAATLPVTLEAGAWLKVSASAVTGFVATHLKRTA